MMPNRPSGRFDERPAATVAKRTVSQRFRLALPLYLCLLLALAVIGIGNQRLLRRQVDLIGSKESLQADVAVARLRAVGVAGPEAVAQWAEAAGMVTVPEAGSARLIAPAPAPQSTTREPTLELSTVWR